MSTRFLEISVFAPDLTESINFYRGLGFTELQTGDIWDYPYAAVTDGKLFIGLHARDIGKPTTTLIMPDLAKVALQLSNDNSLVSMRIDQDSFNLVELADDDGFSLRLVEARTFSPASHEPKASLLGRFLEFTLPVRDGLRAAHFWAPYAPQALAISEAPAMHLRFNAGGLPLGLSEASRAKGPLLCFQVNDLAEVGIQLDRQGWRMQQVHSGFGEPLGAIQSPEGLEFVLFNDDFLGQS